MDAQQVFTFGQQGLYILLIVSAPILLTVLGVGLVVSIFQAATQIHESTLSFVPKIVAAVAVLAIAGYQALHDTSRAPATDAVIRWSRRPISANCVRSSPYTFTATSARTPDSSSLKRI